MTDLFLANEPLIRIAFFLGILVAMAAWEVAAPRRRREIPRLLRWTSNLGVVVVDTILVRLTFPIVAVGLALLAEERGWGLLNIFATPAWLAFLVSLLALDLAIYLQHVMFHAVPALWRLHRMHHTDLEFDVTTGLRFHPAEILLSMGIKLAVVAALGPPAVAVLVFEVLLNATAMFNHSNIRIPLDLDQILRLIVVTPDMHRGRHIPRLLLFAGIAGAVLWAGLNRDQLDPAALNVWLIGLGIWAPVVYVALYVAETMAFLVAGNWVARNGSCRMEASFQ
ncbi:sterol desaturase family protein [uncultured Marinobacter sp.]|uniref:sterol desaturase family protein n=1 Tax=uncultured Marinobacter sp. TaxID=187379 RepID=UPI0030DC11FD|tara:strand:- start:28554 stop:29396 length:843 start_codon:yes stop_codon:yes gene_type:complete